MHKKKKNSNLVLERYRLNKAVESVKKENSVTAETFFYILHTFSLKLEVRSCQLSLDKEPFRVKRQQFGNPSQSVLQPEKEGDKNNLVTLP